MLVTTYTDRHASYDNRKKKRDNQKVGSQMTLKTRVRKDIHAWLCMREYWRCETTAIMCSTKRIAH